MKSILVATKFRNAAMCLLLLLSLLLVACGDTATPIPAATTAAATTAAPAATTAMAMTSAAATTAAPAATTAMAMTTAAATTSAAATTAAGPAPTAVGSTGQAVVTQVAGSTPNAADKPVAGGTFNVAFKSEFSSTDPVVGYSVQTWQVEHQIHRGLLNYDDTTKLVPDLASAMPTVSADGKVFTFKLRSGLKFSDGSPLTAADFKYSWERIFEPAMKSPFPTFWVIIEGAQEYQDSLTKADGKVKEVTGIKVVDDLTLQVTLTAPDQSFLNVITMPEGSPVPKAVVEKYWDKDHKNNDFYKHAVGTGPYMVKDWTEGKGITIVKNPNYYAAADKPGFVDTLVFATGVDETTQILRVKNGELDLAGDGIPAAEYPNLLGDPTFKNQVKAAPIVAIAYFFMNTQVKPFDNVKVRQAFQYMFDRKKVLKLLNNRGTETGAIQPPNMPGYNKALSDQYIGMFDKAKAKQMLTDAGFDFNQTLTFTSADQDDSKKITTSLIADMKEIGIKVEPKFEQSEAFFKDTGKPNAIQIGEIGWFQDFPDPTDFINPILSCGSAVDGGANAAFYCNKDIDAAELKARGIPDPTARLAAYQDIEKKIMADAPWVPLYNQLNTDFISVKAGGYFYHPVWQYDYAKFYKKS